MAFSKQWPTLAEGVFTRVDAMIKTESNPDKKLKLRRFLRSLRTAHNDVDRFSALFSKFEAAEEVEYEAIVAGNRQTLTPGFFEYLEHIVLASHDDKKRQMELVKLGSKVAALGEAFDKASEDQAALDSAAEKFHSLLQVESMEEAERKIDAMAASGELDPALLLTMAKAYSGVKETDYTKEEVKDVMYHLYLKAKEATAREAPAEVRILKHLLTLEDPAQRAAELDNALQPGPELVTDTQDYLSTTPDRMMQTVETVIVTYESQRGRMTMLGQTADLMSPDVIQRLKEIRDILRKQYM